MKELLYSFIYVFRQSAQYLCRSKAATLAGNLDLFYLVPILEFKKLKQKKNILKLAVCSLILFIWFFIQILFLHNINLVKSLVNILKIILCISIYLAVKSKDDFNLFKTVKIVSILYILLTVLALMFSNTDIFWRLGDVVNKYNLQRLQLLYLEPSELGFHLVILLIVLVHFIFKYFLSRDFKNLIVTIILFVSQMSILFLCKSMGAICFGTISLIGFLLYKMYQTLERKKFLKFILLATVVCVFAFFTLYLIGFPIALRVVDTINGKDASNIFRINVTFNTLIQSFKDFHLLGCGFGNMNTAYILDKYESLGLVEVFANSFPTFIFETGIFGILLIIIIFVRLLRTVLVQKSCLKLSLLIFVMSYQVLGGYFTSGLVWAVYGFIANNSDIETKKILSNRKKIAVLHAGAELYGADIVLLNLLKGIDKSKFDVLVVLPCNGVLVDKFREANIKVSVINYPILRRKYMNLKGIVWYVYMYFYSIIKLYKYLKLENIDILHINTTAVLQGILLKYLLNCKMIWHVHEIIKKPKVLSKFITRVCSIFSDQIIVVSQAVKKHMVDDYEKAQHKIKIIYNGVDNEVFNTNPSSSTLLDSFNINPTEDIVVGMIGRVNSWKGQQDFLKAMDIIMKKHRNVKAMLVGGVFAGEEWRMDELKSTISQSQYSDRIIQSDFRPDANEIHKLFDIFVLPSTNPDPLPTVVLEAMASGKPIVAYRHGGVCEMVKDGENGLFANPNDYVELAEQIDVLICNIKMRESYSHASSLRQKKYFSIESYIENFEVLYENI